MSLPPKLELGDTPAGKRRVFTVSGGQFTGAPDVDARIAKGERVPASDYYLRTAPFFETSSPKYAWLA